jgi:signal transduction histidine kinase
MNLGMADDRFERDPEGARKLVSEARDHAQLAIGELRRLSRGIAPPILTDRGLDAAIPALATTSPIPVRVAGRAGERPSAAVERAAYFVVAEAIANAAKHSGARQIGVRLRREPGGLVVEIADDGRGGADPHGSGLRGLRGRVDALDGRFSVRENSPSGTVVDAWLPCASS